MGTKNIYKEKFLDKIKQYKFLIIVLILLIIAKTVIANFDVIKETYKGYYYSFAVSKFNKISQDMEIEELSSREKKIAIFFGRKTCPDCVEAIFEIADARKKFEKSGYKFYYFNTEMKLSRTNKRFLERRKKRNGRCMVGTVVLDIQDRGNLLIG